MCHGSTKLWVNNSSRHHVLRPRVIPYLVGLGGVPLAWSSKQLLEPFAADMWPAWQCILIAKVKELTASTPPPVALLRTLKSS